MVVVTLKYGLETWIPLFAATRHLDARSAIADPGHFDQDTQVQRMMRRIDSLGLYEAHRASDNCSGLS